MNDVALSDRMDNEWAEAQQIHKEEGGSVGGILRTRFGWETSQIDNYEPPEKEHPLLSAMMTPTRGVVGALLKEIDTEIARWQEYRKNVAQWGDRFIEAAEEEARTFAEKQGKNSAAILKLEEVKGILA